MADPTYRAAQPGEFFCPSGGKWYACETGTKFVGCCTWDPCTNGCHGDSLRPAGRSTALDSQSPGGSCGGQTPFWTCEQAPTFWGCCNEDPCMNNSTCPEGKLEPTYWDRPDQYEYFKDLNILLSSTAPRSTSSPTPAASSVRGSGSISSGAIIGGAVGGSLAFAAIIAAVVFLLCRRERRNRKQGSGISSGGPNTSMEENSLGAGEVASPVSVGTAPPMYSWDAEGNHSTHHVSGQEMLGEDLKDSPRSPFSELHSKGSLARIAELPGGIEAKELDTVETTPKCPQTMLGDDKAKQ